MSSEAVPLALEARGIVGGYGGLRVLHNVHLGVPRGSIVCLLGPNGAGKSTVLKTCAGLLRPWSGGVTVDGRAVTGWAPWRIAEEGLCYVPEASGFFAELTVEENLALARQRDGRKGPERLGEVLETFPILGERKRQRAGSLSGGEKRMLALGRAMLTEPRVLLLDEPSFGLAPIVVDQLYDVLADLRRDRGMAMLIVEQYAERVLSIADYAWVLARGEVTYSGRAEDLGQGELDRAYLGAGDDAVVGR